jgi:heme oxygenase
MLHEANRPDGDTDMRQWLRQQTAQDHERLDQLLGACDLSTRDGLTHFLMAHACGMASVAPVAARFVAQHLGQTMPDVCAMIAEDLADLGAPDVPLGDAMPDGGGAGAAYVLIGSRMGVAALRSRGVWSPGSSRYMEDRSLLALWPPMLAWLRDAPADDADALATARASFAAFEHGLHAATRILTTHKAPTPV